MARMEIVTGRERRRNWSDEKKLQILREATTSGLSVADVARQHDVVPQQIYIWRRQLLAKVKADAGVHGALPRFLPVAVVGETDEPESPRDERGGDMEKPRGVAGLGVRKIIESDRSFSSNPDSHFHRKRTAVFMRVDSLGAMAAAHAGVVSGV